MLNSSVDTAKAPKLILFLFDKTALDYNLNESVKIEAS